MASLFSGLIGDLENARKSSLLIEVQQKHLDEILKEQPNFELKNYCNSIFNQSLPPLKTNVVFIDASPNNQAQILHAVFNLIEDSLKREKEVDSALKLGLYCATLGLSEFIDSSITNNVSNYIDGFLDEGIARWLGTKAEGYALNKAEEAADQIINTSKAHYLPGTTLYLAKAAKQKLTSLTDKLNVNHSPSEAMQFMVELVATLGEDAPKLIVINDPFSLDAESLSFCSLLLSYAKDLKQQGQVMPLSLVFNYTSKQPFDNDSKEEKNFQPLLRLRHMAQRYDMLEKPDANIPSPAIKSTTFVGRQDELKQLEQQHDDLLAVLAKNENERRCQWTLVKGEPGTGKTALINKYLSELEKRNDDASKSQIRIRLLNQVGHSSQVTGLASLLQSIHAEANRLTLCYEQNNGWLKKYINRRIKETFGSVKEIYSATQKTVQGKEVTSEDVKKALKAISNIANKDTLYASAEAIYDRKKISKSKAQSADAFSGGATPNKKQEEFDKIASALRHLRNIAVAVSPENKKMPIILVIDDLQWVDELSSEFILKHLIPNYHIEILLTARGADSATSYHLALEKKDQFPYKIKLFDKFYLSEEGKINTSSDRAISCQIDIKGVDRDTLGELIKEVFKSASTLKIKAMTEAIFSLLSAKRDDDKEEVVTLFAIEALNLISDEKFYRSNEGLPILVSRSNGDYELQDCNQDEFVYNLNAVFEELKVKHQEAYQLNNVNDHFSLASYAIMDERLYTIAQYFEEEYCDVITLSLQLSALTGAPFKSKLIRHYTIELANLLPEKSEESDLTANPFLIARGIYASPEHYEILEEVFGILVRYSEGGTFKFHHGLYSTFLRQRMKDKLELLTRDRNYEGFIEKFFDKCIKAAESLLYGSTSKSMLFHSTDEQHLYYMSAIKNTFEMAVEFDNTFWVKRYVNSLISLSILLININEVGDAEFYSRKAKTLLDTQLKQSPSSWKYESALILYCLGKCEYLKGTAGYPIAQAWFEEARRFIEPLYEAERPNFQREYAAILLGLSQSLAEMKGGIGSALELGEYVVTIVKPLYNSDINGWKVEYTGALMFLARIYLKDAVNERSVLRLENICANLEEMYFSIEELKDTPIGAKDATVIVDYISALRRLGAGYSFLQKHSTAISTYLKALQFHSEILADFHDLAFQEYLSCLSELASSYELNLDFKNALDLYLKISDSTPCSLHASECTIFALRVLNKVADYEKFDRLAKQHNIYLTESDFWWVHQLPQQKAFLNGIWGASLDGRGKKSLAREKILVMKSLIDEHCLDNFEAFDDLIKRYSTIQ